MIAIADYRCVECGEIFQNRVQAIKHSIEWKHENFEIIGCDIKIRIKG